MPTAMLAHVEPKAYLDSVNLLLTALAVDTASTREPAQAISDFRRPRFDEAPAVSFKWLYRKHPRHHPISFL
jgi:hypothetical protein